MFGADFHLTPLVETKSGLNTVFKNKEMELFLFYFRLGSFFLLTERGLISVSSESVLCEIRLGSDEPVRLTGAIRVKSNRCS